MGKIQNDQELMRKQVEQEIQMMNTKYKFKSEWSYLNN